MVSYLGLTWMIVYNLVQNFRGVNWEEEDVFTYAIVPMLAAWLIDTLWLIYRFVTGTL